METSLGPYSTEYHHHCSGKIDLETRIHETDGLDECMDISMVAQVMPLPSYPSPVRSFQDPWHHHVAAGRDPQPGRSLHPAERESSDHSALISVSAGHVNDSSGSRGDEFYRGTRQKSLDRAVLAYRKTTTQYGREAERPASRQRRRGGYIRRSPSELLLKDPIARAFNYSSVPTEHCSSNDVWRPYPY